MQKRKNQFGSFFFAFQLLTTICKKLQVVVS
ncbi:hypothetical protein CUZ33_05620 [Streptococcus agalactiae]|uniref:Uncharacterized protein n=1 Tax=Streptococcus agalactiae TaxID=1311 RepID=A0A6A4U048_STRAG|nr:hypothetical protein EGX70_02260 [Streptococcus sp. FDAARGOS_522]KAA8992801.1 hypothetical protein F3165_05590 [Streptococcus agalactiae]KAA9072056.1 hypothetical protein F5J32_05260 [Streptococcus agalactiae]KAA9081241.1 hypothetical protein F5K01_05445 [Streptococcus agalactiae]KAA9120614.1 hypothetical protein F5409_05240 [Streptococcus agalactiae]